MHGYREPADYIAKNAPANGAVFFFGYQDGYFIFNMPTREERRDLSVLRPDKLLLRYPVRRDMAVKGLVYSQAEIADMLNDHNVSYVVS